MNRINEIHRFVSFSIREAMNYKYYNTSLATEIKINTQWIARSVSWYEQEIINSWYNVDNIFVTHKKKNFFLVLLRFKISRIIINNVR